MGFLDLIKNKKKKDSAVEKAPQQKKEEKPAKKEKKAASPKTSKADTKQAYKVLIKPLVTEKATMTGTYYFAVNPKTNKQEIKKAIEALYGVVPVKVNVINYGGKNVRWGRQSGTTKAWKKAIVTLKSGDSIEMFEGV